MARGWLPSALVGCCLYLLLFMPSLSSSVALRPVAPGRGLPLPARVLFTCAWSCPLIGTFLACVPSVEPSQ